ncbi:hypothetical protein LRAMOSA04036 [Lichtheimia ramosa]|uniref:Uncharacterized protein n=1 Tax=Lichtheimia ramosa TaxID=688394 RepID=A0A077WXJ9_9FUNG|nr:hypothetical protein LRAMOSA04036 [Lichtheimia ramosa]
MLTPPRLIKLDPKLSFEEEQFIEWDTNTCLAYMPLREWGDITVLSLNIIKRYPAISKYREAHELLSNALLQVSINCNNERLECYSKAMCLYFSTKAVKRRFKVIFRYKHTVARLEESFGHQMEINQWKATLLIARQVSQTLDNDLL